MTPPRRIPPAVAVAVAAALLVTASACGSATPNDDALSPPAGDTPSAPGESSPQPPSSPPTTPRLSTAAFAAQLLDRVVVPPSARRSAQSPSKGLLGLPEQPELTGTPTVLSRFWSIDAPAAEVYEWLGRHDQGLGLEGTVGSVSSGDAPVDPRWALPHYRTYALAPPAGIAVGHLYVGVAALGSGRTAVAAYAVTLEQPPRPDSEVVPTTEVRAVIGWELAPGGTPVRKPLAGAAAAQLARDFNALRVSTKGDVPCPLIPQGNGTVVTVTFTAGGHEWVAAIPVCPSIGVTRDGAPLPALDFGQPFLRDVKAYSGHLPWDGALAGGGQVTPMGGLPAPPSVR